MKTIKKFIKYFLCKINYRKNLKFDFSVSIGKNSVFEGMNKIHPDSYFKGMMGYGSYIGWNSFLDAKIGRYSSIAPFVRCNIGKHPFTKFVSTSPVFYSKSQYKNGGTFTEMDRYEETVYADKESKYGIVIGNDCWVGEGVFFVGGVTVGDGAVVLAHAVVDKDVSPYAIVGGVPAKIIKYRFDEDTIAFLMKIKWWEKDREWLIRNIGLMEDIEKMKSEYQNK
jgi:acetyltransferase-like isoleucine patch superfamily enzyme